MNVVPLMAQVKNKGIPFIKNYEPKQYQGSAQVWGITQDARGLLYFADNIGIAEFDGINFRRIESDKLFEVGPVFYADDGRVYAGGYGEIGYLQLNQKGAYSFVSLNHLLPQKYRKFQDVWDCHQNADHSIVFKTGSSILFYNADWDSVKVHQFNDAFEFWEFNGKSFCQNANGELFEVRPDSLINLHINTQYKASKLNAVCILPYNDEQSLLVSSNHGLFFLDGTTLSQWKIGYQNFFIDGGLRKAMQLSDGKYLIASQKNGIIILDQTGKVIQHLNQETGISDNSIFTIFEASDKTVWLGTASGIDRIAVQDAFTLFDEHLKLDGKNINYIGKELFEEHLYLGDDKHIYYLPWKSYVNPFSEERFFKKVAPPGGQSWSATVAQEQLLISLNTIIVSVNQQKIEKVADYAPWELVKFPNDSEHLIGEGAEGIMRYDYSNNKWKAGGLIKGFEENCRNMTIDSKENIWVHGYNLGIFKIRLNESLDSVVSLQYYDKQKGFPASNDNVGYFIRDEIVFTTSKGIYTYDEALDSMLVHEGYKNLLGADKEVSSLVEDDDGDVWVVSDGEILFIDFEKDREPIVESNLFYRFKQYYSVDVYPVGDDILFVTEEGMIHYKKKSTHQLNQAFQTVIRKVEIIAEKDSTLFFGGYQNANQEVVLKQPKQTTFTIPYELNAVRFSFVGVFYTKSEHTEYSYWLEGSSGSWSKWGTETQKEYTNLNFGDYKFHVKAKNIYNQVGEEAVFSFSVLRPWYQRYWAYAIYLALGVLLISLIVRFYGQKLRRDNEKLELIIKKRTEEVTAQNEEIIKQRDQLKTAFHNIEQLNEIGKVITSSQSIESLTNTIYGEVNQLMDASMMGVGIYREKENDLFFQTFLEEGKTLKAASHELSNTNRISVQCFINQQEIVIGDYDNEIHKYIQEVESPKVGKRPTSLVYIPIIHQSKKVGVLTVQSFQKNAYSHYHLSLLQNMAVYMAIALENLEVMQQLENLSIVARETTSSVVIMDIDGNVLWVNSAFLRLFGYPTLEEFVKERGQNLLEFSNSSEIDAVYKQMLEMRAPISYEVFNTYKTGEGRWVKTVLNPIIDSNGKIKKIFALGTDITDLKESQEKLLLLTQRLNTINAIDKAMLRSESVEDTIYNSVEELKQRLSAQRMSIALFDFEDNTFTPFAATGVGKNALNTGNRFPLAEFGGIEVLKKEEYYLVSDINKLAKPSSSDLKLAKEGLVSYMLYPMVADGKLIGSLNVCFNDPDKFTHDVIEVIQEVANGVGLSISHHRLQQQLKENHLLLEKRNKNVTNSIKYAEKIQQAILASDENLSRYLHDYFILYKPRDLVSGDFYWLETYKNKVYVAAADCTGHGVPGAMVSVICSNALSKALVEEGNANTGKLLDRTREIVIKRLSRGGKEVRDGMDISLCAIDLEQMTLQWSGANNPLWIINANRKVCPEFAIPFGVGEGGFEFKGDRQPIGVYPKMDPFSFYDIKLQKGDHLYIFTDGYQDQFGGKKGGKYLKKRFKKTLLALEGEEMSKQRTILQKKFKQWRGDLVQIDDVCVIGVKI